MTREILVYQLACGCTDWCTCNQCGLSEPHTPGTSWGCEHHGVTTVVKYVEVPELDPPVENGEIAIVGSHNTFILADGHPMRAGRCVVCTQRINGEPVTVMAVARLGGPSCHCGCVPSAAYLIHGTHLNLTPDELLKYLDDAMSCQTDHPWTD